MRRRSKDEWDKILTFGDNAKIPVPILATAIVSDPQLQPGKIVPVLVADTTNRPDIEEYVRIHSTTGPGDVFSQWGRPIGSTFDYVLVLSVLRPSELTMTFSFDLREYGSFVDTLLRAKRLILHAGRFDRPLEENLNSRRVYMEINAQADLKNWERNYRRALIARYRELGEGYFTARRHAEQTIAIWRTSKVR